MIEMTKDIIDIVREIQLRIARCLVHSSRSIVSPPSVTHD